ncbi:hypothetical protein D9757_009145 [Collybiopsis confluens]|uniref:Uncharacterized protein n=1 Tax=Collybiopsis confluens TaxID=2823264 RepID=A0A8H5H7P3_9AGAR|nr:hypothetical protein D9757_009145 [Collybiopsis confluens]
MRVIDAVRYNIRDNEAADEWANLLPPRGHIVYVDDTFTTNPKAFTVTLFHQLKCLDIIRQEYVVVPPPQEPTHLARHCMNYLRQTILCRPNLRLEPAINEGGIAERNYDTVCHDWTRVYEEAERNQKAFTDHRKREAVVY